MTGLERLRASFALGAVSLDNRAVFVAEGFGLDEDGDLSDAALDFLIEQGRHGWGMLLLELDAPRSPSSRALGAERVGRLRAALRNVELGLSFGDADALRSRVDELSRAGVRIFESREPLAGFEAPAGSIAGVRTTDPRLLVDPPKGFDFLHLGPSPEERVALVGGTLRAPMTRLLDDLESAPALPLMISGRVKDPIGAERLLDYYPVELAGIGRGAIAAPDLFDRAARGEDWTPCTGCMACMSDEFDGPGCAVALSGSDDEIGWGDSTWAIIGASVAAMQIALTLDARGHDVRIYTGGLAIGGSVRLRGRIPDQAESMEAAVYLRGALRRSGVEVSAELPEWIDAEHVLVSLPEPLVPEAGWDVGEDWVDGLGLLREPVERDGPWAVWGSTLLAVELVAYFTMTAREVVLVRRAPEVATDTHPAWAAYYQQWLAGQPIATLDPAEVPAGYTHVIAGRSRTPHPVATAILEARPDAIVCRDSYEPLAQRRTLQELAQTVSARLSTGRTS